MSLLDPELVQQDTMNFDKVWVYERIGECYAQLEEVEKSKLYYEKAEALRKKSSITQ